MYVVMSMQSMYVFCYHSKLYTALSFRVMYIIDRVKYERERERERHPHTDLGRERETGGLPPQPVYNS